MPVSYSFNPRKDNPCPSVRNCPHAGGVGIAPLILLANENEEHRRYLPGTLDSERKRNAQLWAENERLKSQLQQAKLELKLERQNKFATPQQQQANDASAEEARTPADVPSETAAPGEAKKRGAPVGHPGWFRPTPTQYDWLIDVPAPRRCPHCDGKVTALAGMEPVDHLQEDILENNYRVVCYRHVAARCDECNRGVQQPGTDELLNSRIGPYLRSRVLWLRNMIGICYRKLPQIIEELYGIGFTPAALIGFEIYLSEQAEPVVSRSDAGARRMANIMTVGQTARRLGHRASKIYFELYTHRPTTVLRKLYRGLNQRDGAG